MPRKKKPARELTTEQLARRVFPPKVLKELKRAAHEGEPKARRSPKPRGKAPS